MGNKLPKKILKMKGLTMKQKWALYKRGGKVTKRSKGGKVKSIKTYVKKQWGLGRIINAARGIDVLSRPAQGALAKYGFTKEARDLMLTNYTAGISDGEYNGEIAKHTYGGVGTGLVVNHLKSRFGVYRGAGKGKLLSIVQALSPEIIAYSKVDPTEDFEGFNNWRSIADEGYNPDTGTWAPFDRGANKYISDGFIQDKALCVAIGLVQKYVFNTNGWLKLNRYFPKNFNM